MTQRKATWQTLWLIVGPRLPQTEFMVRDGVYLAPLTNEVYERFKLNEDASPRFSGNTDGYVVHYPPRDDVLSRYRLQIDVEGKEQDEAVAQAEQIANRLTTSLSLSVPGGRYFAGLRRVRRAGETQEFLPWSQSALVTLHTPPKPFKPGDIDSALKLFDRLENNPVAGNAYVHLQTAWQLQSTAGSKPLQRSILQHYVLCMETVVTGLAASLRKDQAEKLRLEERAFALAFAEELPRRSDKPKAIREASTKLRDISGANMLALIDLVAPILGIGEQVLENAKELYRFRSRTLSHPGRSRPEDFVKWLTAGPTTDKFCLADVVARAFLSGFCTLSAPTIKS